MEGNGESIVPEEKSEVLSEEEVTAALSEEGIQEEEVSLPSDEVGYEMPEKFKGKSAEEIAKAYTDLEKFKETKAEEGGDEEATEEKEEAPKDKTKDEEAQAEYKRYADKVMSEEGLTDADYAALKEKGYSKEQVDKEAESIRHHSEFETYKADKLIDSVLEPLGGGREKLAQVAEWAASTKTEAEVAEFNSALSKGGKLTQQALMRSLYSEYEAAGNEVDTVLHTNSKQTTPNKGYSTQEQFFKDIDSPEYNNNPKFRAAVEAKMAKSDLF